MRNAVSDLELESLGVVHAGTESFAMTDRINAIAVTDLVDTLVRMR
jgi:hypothetical protein